MVVTLYVDMMSQPCRAIVIYVKMNKLPCQIQAVAIRKGENKTPEFLKINPVGKVPALKDGDFCLNESIAILRYLDAKFGSKCLYPKSLQVRAKIDEYLEWQHTNTRMFAGKVFIGEVVFPGAINMDHALQDMDTMLDQVETIFLNNKKFIAGDELSVADLFAVCEILQPTASGRVVIKNRPKLLEWYDRVREASNPDFDEAYTIFNAVRKRFIKNKL